MINSLRRDIILRKSLEHEYDDICVTIEWLKNNELTVRNNFENNEQTVYPVFVDKETGFPYVMFNGYRMYYPVDTMFSIGDDGKRYLSNVVEGDQYTGSPHLYVFGEHRVNEGDVIVDGGVAEGNFFLSYIDKVKKAYLFEGYSCWLEALKLTIRPFKDKIVLIP